MATTKYFSGQLSPFGGDSGTGGFQGVVPAPLPGDATLRNEYLHASGVWKSLSNADCLYINGLGDSITASSVMSTVYPSTIKQWTQSEVVPARSLRQNGGYFFYTASGGTTASSGSGPTRTNIASTDGTVTWINQQVTTQTQNHSYLYYTEILSNGRLIWDTSTGYNGAPGGAVKAIVVNGGSNYSAPTLVNTDGIEATFTLSNGVITAINILSPGNVNNVGVFPTISDPTGSGAVISWVFYPSGTFGVSGSTTAGMVARLPDVIASKNDIIVVYGGTNDLTQDVPAATIFANLRTCYERLIDAGKKVIAVPISPRSGLTTVRQRTMNRVNTLIVDYCARKSYINPLGYRDIALADPRVYLTDGTSDNVPIGGASNVVGAMTYDGLHLSARGAFYQAMTIIAAAERWIARPQTAGMRAATQFDAYAASDNPTGNLLEAYPWTANTAVAVGDLARNDSPARVYYCTSPGTTASSGGPTGTGSSITDGTVTWAFAHLAGMSVFNSGTGSAPSAAAGVTITGNLAGGYFMQRNSGTAAGTLTAAIESPWSNGQVGARQSLAFSLGSGTSTDLWLLQFGSYVYQRYGLLPADLANTLVEFEVELEVSNLANCNGIYLQLYSDYASSPPNDFIVAQAGALGGGSGLNATLPNSSGEMLSYPNNGLMTIRTKPVRLPLDLSTLSTWLFFSFNASGGANSATGTFKINRFAFRKVLL